MKKLVLATLAALALTACGDKNYYTTNPETEDIELRDTVMVYDTLVVNDTLHYLVSETDTINDTLVVPITEYDTTTEKYVVVDTLYTKKEQVVYISDTVVVTDTIKQSVSPVALRSLYSADGALDACGLRGMRLGGTDEVDSAISNGIADTTGWGNFDVVVGNDSVAIGWYNYADGSVWPNQTGYAYKSEARVICFPIEEEIQIVDTLEWKEFRGDYSWSEAANLCSLAGMIVPTYDDLEEAFVDKAVNFSWMSGYNAYYEWKYWTSSVSEDGQVLYWGKKTPNFETINGGHKTMAAAYVVCFDRHYASTEEN